MQEGAPARRLFSKRKFPTNANTNGNHLSSMAPFSAPTLRSLLPRTAGDPTSPTPPTVRTSDVASPTTELPRLATPLNGELAPADSVSLSNQDTAANLSMARGDLPCDGSTSQGHHARTSTASTIACRYKMCKRVTKFDLDEEPLVCASANCNHCVHISCSKRMLAEFGAESTFESSICGKRCYNARLKAMRDTDGDNDVKKRVMWHNDGPTSSVSSLSCLIDWLTTGNNYNRFRGGKGQTGASKLVVAGEVVRLITESGIPTVRTAKDVQTKIGVLEDAYRKASDWLSATGQGVQDETSLRAAILDRCPPVLLRTLRYNGRSTKHAAAVDQQKHRSD
jgi:hypothetical protein